MGWYVSALRLKICVNFKLGQKSVYVFHPDDIQAVMQREGKWPIGGGTGLWPFITATNNLQMTNVALSQVTQLN